MMILLCLFAVAVNLDVPQDGVTLRTYDVRDMNGGIPNLPSPWLQGDTITSMDRLVAIAGALIEPPLAKEHTLELADGGYLCTRLAASQHAWLQGFMTALRKNVPAAPVQRTFDVELQVLGVPERACERVLPGGRPRPFASLEERVRFERELAGATKDAGGGLVEELAPRFSAGLLRGVVARIHRPERVGGTKGCDFEGLLADLGDGRIGLQGQLTMRLAGHGAIANKTPRQLVIPLTAGIPLRGAVALPGPKIDDSWRAVLLITMRDTEPEDPLPTASRPSVEAKEGRSK